MADPKLPLRHRRAVRAILLDPQARVLLLNGRGLAAGDAATWWFTPGGGIRDGESPTDALRRECWEELGFAPEGAEGPIAHRRSEFAFDGRWLVQDADFYWARVPAFDPAPQGLTDLERRFIMGWRWWTAQELRVTNETIYPKDLSALVHALIGT